MKADVLPMESNLFLLLVKGIAGIFRHLEPQETTGKPDTRIRGKRFRMMITIRGNVIFVLHECVAFK